MRYPQNLLTEIETLIQHDLFLPFTLNALREKVQSEDCVSLLQECQKLSDQLNNPELVDEEAKNYFTTILRQTTCFLEAVRDYKQAQFHNTVNTYDKKFTHFDMPKETTSLDQHALPRLASAFANFSGILEHYNRKNYVSAQRYFDFALLHASSIQATFSHAIISSNLLQTRFELKENVLEEVYKHSEALEQLAKELSSPDEQKTLATLFNKVGQFIKAALKTQQQAGTQLDNDMLRKGLAAMKSAYQLWPESNVICNNYGIYLLKFSNNKKELLQAIALFQEVIDRDPSVALVVARDYQCRTINKLLALEISEKTKLTHTLHQRTKELAEILKQAVSKGDYDSTYVEKKKARLGKNLGLLKVIHDELHTLLNFADLSLTDSAPITPAIDHARKKYTSMTGLTVLATIAEEKTTTIAATLSARPTS